MKFMILPSIVTSKMLTVGAILIFCLAFNTDVAAQFQAQKLTNSASQVEPLAEIISNQNEEGVSYVITAQHTSRTSGIHHVYLRQAIQGIEVLGTESSIHTITEGTIVRKYNNFIHDIASTITNRNVGISASDAIIRVSQQMGYTVSDLQEIERSESPNQETLFNKGGISISNIPVKLAYYYREGYGTTMVWDLSIEEIHSSDWWNFRVDAQSGVIIDKNNYTVSCFTEGNNHDHSHNSIDSNIDYTDHEESLFYTVENEPALMVGSYNVIAMPDESPQHGSMGRQIVVNPDNALASPYGWHDTDGIAGAESNYTIGNNTDAYDDRSSTITGTGSGDNTERAFGDTGLIFNDPFNTDVTAPGTNGSIFAAVTNLFYWANIIHDVTYQYGFDEASGNFQLNNYGNGGIGNDSVRSEAQDGSGTCNANFSTPSDGGRGRMQMYVCNTRDGDFDNAVIAHEYGHGISNRLTGGAGNANCLNRISTPEQMGEGWSDFYGLLLTMEVGDARTDSRGVGTWLVGQGANGPGIRPTPYSTDFSVNSTTYSALPSSVVPHGVGYVWATMLWELTWDLIDDQGFNTDFYTGTGGNNIALNLVTEGLKLQPCSPGFVDGRDAILAADAALYGGAYNCIIWEAFARRGLGYSASQGNSSSIADGTEAFDLPPGLGSPTLDTVNSLCITSGIQNGLGGGTPIGGVYSGIGVTDDGNGTTFTFDPSINGVGSVLVTYTITNLCTNTTEFDTDTIVIGNNTLAIICPDDITTCYPDINYELPRPNDGCFGRSSNRITQNNTETINNGVDCAGESSGHLRRFNLSTEGVVRDYLITGIEVGINNTTGANIIANIYLDNTIDNAITSYTVPISDSVIPYATATSAVPAGSGFVHTVPFDVFLPAGTAFTVEVISPISQDFMIGYNDSGVNNVPDATATGYTSCSGGLAYSDLVAFNLGENAVLIQVQGTESNSLTTTQTTGIPPGETYPLGITTNTFETTDGSSTVSCSFDVNVLSNTVTTYTGGNWDNGVPSATDVAIIDDTFNTSGAGNTDIDACACEVVAGGSLTVAAGDYLNVLTDVVIDAGGSITVEHTANVVQIQDDGIATNDGSIDLTITTPILSNRDFMVMGSPLTAETRNDVFASAFLVLNSTPANFMPHPGVPAGGTNFADDKLNNGKFWDAYAGAINVGEGFIVRPQTGYADPAVTSYDMVYTQGAFNTGTIDRPIVFNGLGDNPSGTPNILANPYPSAIDGTSLINDNALINEIYFWEHLTPPSTSFPGSNNMNFSMDDISMFNTSMPLPAANDPGVSTTPNGVISSGQGFAIKAQAAGTVSFTNSMRLTSGNTTLRNPTAELAIDKLLLEVRNVDYGVGSYTGVAFNPIATEELDLGYDSDRLATVVSLFSHLQDGSEQLGIQTMPEFDAAMKIPMGFTTQVDSDLEYVIAIATMEGNQITNATIYLVDHVLGTITNLNETDYVFRSAKATYEGRFTLKFETEDILGSQDQVLRAIGIFPNPAQQRLNVVSPQAPINEIVLHDISGRRVRVQSFDAKNRVQVDVSNLDASLYFVTISTEQGTITKRLIKE